MREKREEQEEECTPPKATCMQSDCIPWKREFLVGRSRRSDPRGLVVGGDGQGVPRRAVPAQATRVPSSSAVTARECFVRRL